MEILSKEICSDKKLKDLSSIVLEFSKNISIIFAIILFSREKIDIQNMSAYIEIPLIAAIVIITMACMTDLFLSMTKTLGMEDRNYKKCRTCRKYKKCSAYKNDRKSRPRIALLIIAGLVAIAFVIFSLWVPLKVTDNKIQILQLTTAQPATAQPTTAQPTTAQPTTAQPTTAQPATAQPTTAQPATAQPATAQPTTAQPTTAQPATAQPTTAQPATAQPVIYNQQTVINEYTTNNYGAIHSTSSRAKSTNQQSAKPASQTKECEK